MRHIQLYSLVSRRQHRKQATVQSLRRRLGRFSLGCGAVSLLALVACILGLSLVYASLVDHLPSLSQIPALLNPDTGLLMQPTRFYDRSGQKLLYSLDNPGIPRRYLSLDPTKENHLSPELVRVTLGMIDPNFWSSPGFRIQQLTSAQPGTISERLVSDLLLWQEPQGLRRSLRMRLLAAELIAQYGHIQVLEWYLNSASYGHLAFGADSAARLYLEKSAVRLNLSEAALLFAASQSPALNPLDAPSEALERQRQVLEGLRSRGVITQAEFQRAVSEKLLLAQASDPALSPAAAFSHQVLDRLAMRFGLDRLERGGLRVITTLDYELQLELSCLVRTQLARLTGESERSHLPDGNPCVSTRLLPTLPPSETLLPENGTASAVVFDPQTGQVLALLGDTTVEGEASLLTPQQPGSLLTPFVAVTGFARGMGPASLTWDIPPDLSENADGKSVSPLEANVDGKYQGPVRMRMAIANDYLTPQAQLLNQMGASSIWRLSSELGLSGLAEETSAGLLYKGGSVSPLEMAQAYGVFASQGNRVGQRLLQGGDLQPATVLYVEDSAGTTWFDGSQAETQTVLSAPLAYLIHHVLGDATARWPSLGYPNPLEIGRPSAAKIGQVEGGKQVWAAGYTPQRVAVFSLTLPTGSGSEQLQPRMVAGMWHALMQYVSHDQPAVDWPEPSGISHVEVCDPSGQLPTSACPEVVSEVFLTGSEPTAPNSLYRDFQINRETGRLATVFTPPALIEEKTFLVVPPQARTWAQTTELPVPPENYDAIQPPDPSPAVQIKSPPLFSYIHGLVTLKGTAAGSGFRTFQIMVGQGLNPQTWLQVGQAGKSAVTEGDLAVWDTQSLEGLYAVRLQVVREDQTVETATIQVTVDNTAPIVRIPYPLAGQEFSAQRDQTIIFQADVSDAVGIRRLVWSIDGKDVGESIQSPYAFPWQAQTGSHTLEVRAYDEAGNIGKSNSIQFSIQ